MDRQEIERYIKEKMQEFKIAHHKSIIDVGDNEVLNTLHDKEVVTYFSNLYNYKEQNFPNGAYLIKETKVVPKCKASHYCTDKDIDEYLQRYDMKNGVDFSINASSNLSILVYGAKYTKEVELKIIDAKTYADLEEKIENRDNDFEFGTITKAFWDNAHSLKEFMANIDNLPKLSDVAEYSDIAEFTVSVKDYIKLTTGNDAIKTFKDLMEFNDPNLWDYPEEDLAHCLEEQIPVIKVMDENNSFRYFEVYDETVDYIRDIQKGVLSIDDVASINYTKSR